MQLSSPKPYSPEPQPDSFQPYSLQSTSIALPLKALPACELTHLMLVHRTAAVETSANEADSDFFQHQCSYKQIMQCYCLYCNSTSTTSKAAWYLCGCVPSLNCIQTICWNIMFSVVDESCCSDKHGAMQAATAAAVQGLKLLGGILLIRRATRPYKPLPAKW